LCLWRYFLLDGKLFILGGREIMKESTKEWVWIICIIIMILFLLSAIYFISWTPKKRHDYKTSTHEIIYQDIQDLKWRNRGTKKAKVVSETETEYLIITKWGDYFTISKSPLERLPFGDFLGFRIWEDGDRVKDGKLCEQ
jgi:hypothetical protein